MQEKWKIISPYQDLLLLNLRLAHEWKKYNLNNEPG